MRRITLRKQHQQPLYTHTENRCGHAENRRKPTPQNEHHSQLKQGNEEQIARRKRIQITI